MAKPQMIRAEIDMRKVVADLAATDREFNAAVPRVINRTLLKLRTRAVRRVSRELKIRPQSLITKRAKIDKATRARPVGAVRVLVTPVSAIGLSGARETRRGVSASGRAWDGAFIAVGKNNNQHVFRRLGVPRLPIDAIKIPIRQETEEILREEQKTSMNDAIALMRRELTYRISLRGRK